MRKTQLALAIRGAGGGAQEEPRTPVEAPDSLRNIAYAHIVDLLSEGECFGWADPEHPFRCMYFNETVVENDDGSRNFKNFTLQWRFGTQTQDYLPGSETVESEVGAGVVLTYDTPWSHAFTNLNLNAVRVRLSVLALTKTNPKNGDISGYKVDYKIELSTDGGSFVTIHTNSFNGKTTTKYERSIRIALPVATDTGWVIRVSRLTPNSTTATIQDITMIESYAELIDAKLRRPMSAIVDVTVDASQFNAIPSRAYHWKGRLIKVPTNYDPETREYDGIWDGTFQVRYSNNPAWCFYDMALNDRYGLGDRIPAELVNKWALYQIAQYCDGLVDDGFGGQEPRFTCNLYLQTQQQAFQVMQDMATIFRGLMYAAQGSIMAVADMPTDPIYTYTRANVLDGKFNYAGSSRKVRHTVALVSWNDMNDFGRPKVEYIEDEEGIARYGIQPTQIIALGCTSQGQARRQGKYLLACERYETDMVSFGVGLDGTFVPPGSIVRIADPHRANRRMGGRIRGYTVVGMGAEVEVDRNELLSPGNSIVCILPNGLPEVRTIASVADNIISIDEGFSSPPIPHSVWAAEADDLATQRFRVIGVTENTDNMGYTLTALQHVAGIFDFVEQDIKITEPPITTREVIGAPEEVVVFDFERVYSNLPTLVMGAEWEAVEFAVKYEVHWQRNDGNWSPPYYVQESRFELEGAQAGEYRVKVAAVDSKGFQSRPTISDLTTVETPNFTIVTPISSDGGVLILDASVGEEFLLILTEDITSVLFYNINVETTFIIEVRNPASWDITFDSSVVPVSGEPYHPTTGGTVDAPKIDTIGLHTDNAGVTWALRADLDDNPGTGGGGGAMSVTVSPSPAYAYAAFNPDVDVVATVAGGTAPITVQWSRRPGGVGNWNGSTNNTGGAAFTCSDDNSLTPNFSRTGTSDGYVAQNWQIVATDATGLTATAVLEVTLEDDGVVVGGGGQQCVWAQAWLPDGRQAQDVRVGSRIMGVDPETMERITLLVSYSKRAMADCYLLRCANGAELTCSDSAPIPTRDGTLVLAPDMLNKETITLIGTREWSKVVAVMYVGRMPVQHITAENGNFFAGNERGRYMAHHNIKWPPSELY